MIFFNVLLFTPLFSESIEKNNLAKKVLISREIMSGDLFTFYKDYKSHYIRLYKGLSEAKIIMSLRYQTDWIISCYRETLHEHHYQTIKQFLGFERGEKKFVKANYKNLDYSGILRQIKSLFLNCMHISTHSGILLYFSLS